MQVKKKKVRDNILQAARTLFLQHGFKKSSMRSIAKKSGTHLSNIYNYFANKDAILVEIVQPLLESLDKIHSDDRAEMFYQKEVFDSQTYQEYWINIFIDLTTRFRQEFYLLLFGAHGSSLENFQKQFTNRQTKNSLNYLEKLQKRYPHIRTNFSEFFLHTYTSWQLAIFAEVVSHDLSHAELEKFVSEFVAFSAAGWSKLINI